MLGGIGQHAGDLPEVREEAFGELEIVGWRSHNPTVFPFRPPTQRVRFYTTLSLIQKGENRSQARNPKLPVHYPMLLTFALVGSVTRRFWRLKRRSRTCFERNVSDIRSITRVFPSADRRLKY